LSPTKDGKVIACLPRKQHFDSETNVFSMNALTFNLPTKNHMPRTDQ